LNTLPECREDAVTSLATVHRLTFRKRGRTEEVSEATLSNVLSRRQQGAPMTTPSIAGALTETLELFGDISSNLVYITEELPSLQLPRDTEDRIVNFCCGFLECLVDGDKQIQNIMTALHPAPTFVPENAVQILEAIRADIWTNVQALHNLVTEVRVRSKETEGFSSLEVLLNESGANILKDFMSIQGTFDGIAGDVKQQSVSPR
jgi:hypothetical protein